jgi:hypothetical protein
MTMTTVPDARAQDKRARKDADRAEALRRAEHGAKIAAKLLAGHDHKADRKPVTARAFGQALAVTEPGSEHGRLLAAALRPGSWGDRPETERVVLRLARRGDTPTASAVQNWLDGIRQHQERGHRLRAEAAPLIEGDAVRAAAHVAQVVRDTGAGPTWRELARAMDWPMSPWGTHSAIIGGLAMAGWLEFTSRPRSLRPGPAVRGLANGRHG